MRQFHSRGFTLVEATVAVAIVAMISIAATTLFRQISINAREVRDQDLALRIARQQIEIYRLNGYSALPASGRITNQLLSSFASSSAVVTVSAYTSKTKKVDVAVLWQGSQGMRSVSLSTFITQSSGL